MRVGMPLLALSLICGGCKIASTADTSDRPWVPPSGQVGERDPDTVEYLMQVQRYKSEHGRLPPPDADLDR